MKRIIIAVAMLAVFSSGVFAQGTDADKVVELTARVAALEKRIAELEATIKANEERHAKESEKNDMMRAVTLLNRVGNDQEGQSKEEDETAAELQKLLKPLLRLDRDNRYVKRSNCRAIAAMGPKAIAATPMLIRTLQKDTDRHTRQYAAEALGSICKDSTDFLALQALAVLYQASKDDSYSDVRHAAERAARQIEQ